MDAPLLLNRRKLRDLPTCCQQQQSKPAITYPQICGYRDLSHALSNGNLENFVPNDTQASKQEMPHFWWLHVPCVARFPRDNFNGCDDTGEPVEFCHWRCP